MRPDQDQICFLDAVCFSLFSDFRKSCFWSESLLLHHFRGLRMLARTRNTSMQEQRFVNRWHTGQEDTQVNKCEV